MLHSPAGDMAQAIECLANTRPCVQTTVLPQKCHIATATSFFQPRFFSLSVFFRYLIVICFDMAFFSIF
jgi:hypothetical protein